MSKQCMGPTRTCRFIIRCSKQAHENLESAKCKLVQLKLFKLFQSQFSLSENKIILVILTNHRVERIKWSSNINGVVIWQLL